MKREEILGFIGAFLGWVFDSMDATIYALVMVSALKELLKNQGIANTESHVGFYGGLIFSLFLIGWAIGGVSFGYVADKIGRVRALTITIGLYSLFTGLSSLSQNVWELAIFRFITAIGIGGEWAGGATLVAEIFKKKNRIFASSLLQSAWAIGFLTASLIYFTIGRYHSWRVMFLIGILPAILALVFRLFVKESEEWLSNRNTFSYIKSLKLLFTKDYKNQTIVGALLAFVAVFGLWGVTNWTPALISYLLHKKDIAYYVGLGSIALNIGALFGYIAFGIITRFLGIQNTFMLFFAGSFLMGLITFLYTKSFDKLLVSLALLGFFNNGVFSGFSIYFPQAYPSFIRATGAGFCFNIGRTLASIGPFITGYITYLSGSVARAGAIASSIYIVGVLVALFLKEKNYLQ
ncbi:MFS transporter [Hydrogenobaculum acidophilum]